MSDFGASRAFYLDLLGFALRYEREAPRAVALRIVTRIVAGFDGSARGGAIARLVAELEQGSGGNVGGVAATSHDGAWVFRPEAPRRS